MCVWSPDDLDSKEARVYLHCIQCKLVEVDPHYKYSPHYPERDTQCLGFLSSSPLPRVGPFHLYPPSGRVSVTVTCVSTVSLSQTQLDLCQGFHQYIFSRVLRLTDTLEFLYSQVVCYIVVSVVYCTVLYRLGAGAWRNWEYSLGVKHLGVSRVCSQRCIFSRRI